MNRPTQLVVCVGTATEIGKTWVGAATLRALRDGGRRVAARKPAQSFDPADPHPTDAEVLAAATGEAPETVCRPDQWLPVPLAPPMAAAALGRDAATLAHHVAAIDASWPAPPVEVGWVETVGGPRSPLASDGDGIDLARALGADRLVLVADAALGTINNVRLCHDALGALGVPVDVLLNRYDPADDLHAANLAWLRETDGFDVHTDPAALAARLGAAVSPGHP